MPETCPPVLIFAAGFGTRMGELTKSQPKPLIQVAGQPLIDQALDLVHGAGCTKVVSNLHYMAKMLEAHLAPKGVETVIEAPDILETGGGLRNALPLLGDGPVVTVNPDAVWAGPNPVQMVLDHWEPEKMDALLLCLPKKNALGHGGGGDFLLSDAGRISRGPGLVYGGIQIIKTERLEEIEEKAFSLNRLWDLMLDDGRLFGLVYPGRWCDVGHPAGIKLAEDMLEGQDV